jgi:hypothetical protein
MDTPFFSLYDLERVIQAGKAQIYSVVQRLCAPMVLTPLLLLLLLIHYNGRD